MSPQSLSSQSGGPVQKQKLNVYTVMLILSFVALVIGCVLLAMELGEYGGAFSQPWNTGSARPATTSQLQAPAWVDSGSLWA